MQKQTFGKPLVLASVLGVLPMLALVPNCWGGGSGPKPRPTPTPTKAPKPTPTPTSARTPVPNQFYPGTYRFSYQGSGGLAGVMGQFFFQVNRFGMVTPVNFTMTRVGTLTFSGTLSSSGQLQGRINDSTGDLDQANATLTNLGGVLQGSGKLRDTRAKPGKQVVNADFQVQKLMVGATVDVSYAGHYRGTSKGTFAEPGEQPFSVTSMFDVTVDKQGKLTGTVTDSEGNVLTVSGTVDSAGRTNFSTAATSNVSATFSGEITPTGAVSGTYTSVDPIGGKGSGSFTGHKV